MITRPSLFSQYHTLLKAMVLWRIFQQTVFETYLLCLKYAYPPIIDLAFLTYQKSVHCITEFARCEFTHHQDDISYLQLKFLQSQDFQNFKLRLEDEKILQILYRINL